MSGRKATSADEVLASHLQELARAFPFKGGSLALLDAQDRLAIVAAFGTIDAAARGVRLRKGEGIAGTVAATGRTIYSPDLDRATPVAAAARSIGTNRLIRSYLCAPLVRRGAVIGVLEVDSDRPDAFAPRDVALVERSARSLARSAAVGRARAALAAKPG